MSLTQTEWSIARKTGALVTGVFLSARALLAPAAIAYVVIMATPEVHAEVVTYRLDVDNTWSTTTHPGLFPDAK